MEKRVFADRVGSYAPLMDGEAVDFLLAEGYIVLDAVILIAGAQVSYYRRPDMAPRLHSNHDFQIIEKGPDGPDDAKPSFQPADEVETPDEEEFAVGDRVRVVFWGEPGTEESRKYEGKEGVVTVIHGYIRVDIGDGMGDLPCRAVELEHVVADVEDEKIVYTTSDFEIGDRVVIVNWKPDANSSNIGEFGTVAAHGPAYLRLSMDNPNLASTAYLPVRADEVRPLTSADFKTGMIVEGVKWEDGAERFAPFVVGKYGKVVEYDGNDEKYVDVEFAGVKIGGEATSLPMRLDEIRLVKE